MAASSLSRPSWANRLRMSVVGASMFVSRANLDDGSPAIFIGVGFAA
jgi:homoaconitase/3-isopropylmalate dehydratase large subunit